MTLLYHWCLLLLYGAWAVCGDQTAVLVCPGERVSFNCSLEQPRGSIKWKLWCQCSAESCRDNCTAMPSTVVNSRDSFQHGNACPSAEYTPAITYEHNFTSVRDMNDILVSSAVLTIDVPLEFQQQSNTRMCLECNDQPPYGYLEILGLPFPPRNFSFNPNYAFITDHEIVINFMWSPATTSPFHDDVIFEFRITNNFTVNSTFTESTTMTATLKFNETYFISIYTLICNSTLASGPFITSIVLDKDTLCLPPPAPPGVNITIIMAGSLLSFQCEEGLVPEGRLGAQCGLEGRWIPDPTLHMCVNVSTETGTVSTTCQPAQPCISTVLLAVISVSAVLMTLFLNVIFFTLGVLVGVCRRKTRQQASTTVSAALSEGASADMSETTTGVELERVHDYEDIVLTETKDMDTFTTNVAYGKQ